VTGDGMNDAPALKKADIGIAMGSGNEVAMESATMVLLDSSFESIVTSIQLGRLVFNNLNKVMIYSMTAGDFAEIVPSLITNTFLGTPLPLSTFLMIVICVLTDLVPEIALVYEEPELDLLCVPPRRKDEHLADKHMWFQAFGFIGLFECIFAHINFFVYLNNYAGIPPSGVFLAYGNWEGGYYNYSQDQLNEFNYTGISVYFMSLVIMQLGNVYAQRTSDRSVLQQNPFWGEGTRNLMIPISNCCAISIAIFVLYLPAINNVLNTRPIPGEFYGISFAWAFCILLLDETRKLIQKNKTGSYR